MSSDSGRQLVGGLIGATIGFFIAGPTGAQVGFALGSSLVASQQHAGTVEGPRLENLQFQGSEYGTPLPVYYGTLRGGGQVIWLENDRIKEIKEKEEVGGKGGPSQTKVTYHYFATFAVSLGEGPIAGVRRIWADSVLIFDGSDLSSASSILANAAVVQPGAGASEDVGSEIGRIVVYPGTDTQDPDSRMEAEHGVGNVPAYRGTAYVMVEDMDLERWGNRVPMITAEVVTVGSETRPSFIGTMDDGIDLVSEGIYWTRMEEGVGIFHDRTSLDYRYDPDGNLIDKRSNVPPQWKNSSDFGFLGHLGEWDVWVTRPGQPSHVLVGSDGFELQRWQVGDEGDTGQIGAALTPDGRYLVLSRADAQGPYYVIYDSQVSEYRRGRMPYEFRWNGGRPSVGPAPAIESTLDRLWILGSSFILLELDVNGDFVEIGSLAAVSRFWSGIAERGVCWVYEGQDQNSHILTAQSAPDITTSNLRTIIENLAHRARLDPNDVDATALTAEVRGFSLTQPASLMSAVTPLRSAFPFDIVEQGYQLRFVPRGGNPVRTLTAEDLRAREPGQDEPSALIETRTIETRLPRRVFVEYQDPGTDYEKGTQYAARIVTDSVHEETVRLPIVLTADEAAQVADVMLREAWANRVDMNGDTTIQQAALMPADVVTLDVGGVLVDGRIRQIDDGRPGLRKLGLAPDGAALYSSTAVGVTGRNPSTARELPGPTDLVLADLPTLRDVDDGPGVYAAMSGVLDGWRGSILYRSRTADSGYRELLTTTTNGVIGETTDALPDGPVWIWDRASTVNVSLTGGQLSSVTEDEVLDGANALAIAAGDGWEIVQFANATLEADGTYTLDTLLRGRKGTEHRTGDHAAADRVVLLSGDELVRRVPMDTDLLGIERHYKAASLQGTLAGARNHPFTVAGRSLMPYSPVHVAGTRDGSDNLTITWIRRTRIAGEWRDRVDVRLGEETEAYEVDVLDGANVVRTLSSASPSVTYTASDQTTDFGAPQASVDVRIHQLSATVGRGHPTEATL